MGKETKDEDFVDQLLEWYRKGIENGTIKPPDPNGPRYADELLQIWREKEERKVAKPVKVEEQPQMAAETAGFKDIRGIRHFKEEEGQLVELGRLCFRGNAAKLYLPKRVCNALKLDRERDKTLVIVGVDENTLFLIKDKEVANELKPRILEARKMVFDDR